MSALIDLLTRLRNNAQSEREKGDYFEKVAQVYFRHEPYFKDLYQNVWLWSEWRKYQQLKGYKDPGVDTGIDLVAKTFSGEYHAIQAKFYSADTTLLKEHIDSFFTESGKTFDTSEGRKSFTHRYIIATTDNISQHADASLESQLIPVHKITLADLENSKIDWDTFFQTQTLKYKEPKVLRDYQRKAINDVISGLAKADRGKLIMACGTGKTFTSLRLAEKMAGGGEECFIHGAFLKSVISDPNRMDTRIQYSFK